MKNHRTPIILSIFAAFGIGIIAGNLLRNNGGSQSQTSFKGEIETNKTSKFTCSMHPQIQLPDKKAKCPICGMSLIPVSKSSASNNLGPREIKLSEKAQKLAEIETAVVEKKYATTEIRMSGKIEYDETKIAYITARIPGRLERLFVDYTGIKVKKGDHLVQIYSPELYTAQEEFIQAIATSKNLTNSSNEFIKKQALQNIKSAREKLSLLGLSETQVAEIEKNKSASERVTLKSPIEGVTVEKKAVDGMYVKTGSQIYKIVDLSTVWVKLDAYESDLPWIRYGQQVEFHTEAYPGETFKGKIAFIDPVINSETRTVKIRVNLPNPNEKLKPDMFVRAVVKSHIAKGGKVMEPELQGKWISPMHPEIVKDKPGPCDICGMDLVRAESMGYVSTNGDKVQKPLVIPITAPLITGKRAVVYVEKSPGIYQGRDVTLGSRASNYYIVEKGLKEGEKVVINGNFKIDSAIQILGKPSMMNPSSSEPAIDQVERKQDSSPLKLTSASSEAIDQIIDNYFKIQFHLSHDDINGAVESAKKLKPTIDKNLLLFSEQESNPKDWIKAFKEILLTTERIIDSESLASSRKLFFQLSNQTISILERIEDWQKEPVFQYHCPMAFKGKGASWLQQKKGTENPYYGSTMFKCGSLENTFQ